MHVYQACVLSVLLYGSECWTPLKRQLKKLDSFHNRCIRTIMDISNKQQWEQCITSNEIRRKWGDSDTATLKVKKRRLEWLGHVARMPDFHIPKICLFNWMPQPRPRGGPRLRCEGPDQKGPQGDQGSRGHSHHLQKQMESHLY